jgi:hypothetical protein
MGSKKTRISFDTHFSLGQRFTYYYMKYTGYKYTCCFLEPQ